MRGMPGSNHCQKGALYDIFRSGTRRPSLSPHEARRHSRTAGSMLSFLRIRNLAIVKDLSLQWGEGLNLLTGETGAGKSILIGALGLVLGDRASPEMVRGGEEKAEISAVFRPGGIRDCIRDLLESVGVEPEGEEIVVRREIGEASRSRQFLCDTTVSLSTLRRFGDLMVEVQ